MTKNAQTFIMSYTWDEGNEISKQEGSYTFTPTPLRHFHFC